MGISIPETYESILGLSSWWESFDSAASNSGSYMVEEKRRKEEKEAFLFFPTIQKFFAFLLKSMLPLRIKRPAHPLVSTIFVDEVSMVGVDNWLTMRSMTCWLMQVLSGSWWTKNSVLMQRRPLSQETGKTDDLRSTVGPSIGFDRVLNVPILCFKKSVGARGVGVLIPFTRHDFTHPCRLPLDRGSFLSSVINVDVWRSRQPGES